MKSGYVRKRNDYTMLRPDVPVKKICLKLLMKKKESVLRHMNKD